MLKNLSSINKSLEKSSAPLILHWAADTFGKRLVVTSSFQTQSLPLLHLVSRICPNVCVLFLDTHFHFDETIDFKDQLINDFGINVQILEPELSKSEFLSKHGKLYERDPSMCCFFNKVDPLQRELDGVDAWISGVRRDQTKERHDTPIVSLQPNGKIKICPLALWTENDVEKYIKIYRLPRHPLWNRGYKSIGCEPCTAPVENGEDYRSGRWQYFTKTECGLHLNNKK